MEGYKHGQGQDIPQPRMVRQERPGRGLPRYPGPRPARNTGQESRRRAQHELFIGGGGISQTDPAGKQKLATAAGK